MQRQLILRTVLQIAAGCFLAWFDWRICAALICLFASQDINEEIVSKRTFDSIIEEFKKNPEKTL